MRNLTMIVTTAATLLTTALAGLGVSRFGSTNPPPAQPPNVIPEYRESAPRESAPPSVDEKAYKLAEASGKLIETYEPRLLELRRRMVTHLGQIPTVRGKRFDEVDPADLTSDDLVAALSNLRAFFAELEALYPDFDELMLKYLLECRHAEEHFYQCAVRCRTDAKFNAAHNEADKVASLQNWAGFFDAKSIWARDRHREGSETRAVIAECMAYLRRDQRFLGTVEEMLRAGRGTDTARERKAFRETFKVYAKELTEFIELLNQFKDKIARQALSRAVREDYERELAKAAEPAAPPEAPPPQDSLALTLARSAAARAETERLRRIESEAEETRRASEASSIADAKALRAEAERFGWTVVEENNLARRQAALLYAVGRGAEAEARYRLLYSKWRSLDVYSRPRLVVVGPKSASVSFNLAVGRHYPFSGQAGYGGGIAQAVGPGRGGTFELVPTEGEFQTGDFLVVR